MTEEQRRNQGKAPRLYPKSFVERILESPNSQKRLHTDCQFDALIRAMQAGCVWDLGWWEMG